MRLSLLTGGQPWAIIEVNCRAVPFPFSVKADLDVVLSGRNRSRRKGREIKHPVSRELFGAEVLFEVLFTP